MWGIEGHKSGVCVLVFSNLFMHIVSAPSADPEPLPEAMAEPQPDPEAKPFLGTLLKVGAGALAGGLGAVAAGR